MRHGLLFAIVLGSTFMSAGACQAEMAIAIGMTSNIYKDGFVWGGGFDPDSRQTALDICRGVKAPEIGELPANVSKVKKLCKIVTVFSDKCFAIAHDGSVRVPATGVGWSVEVDLKSAEDDALTKCRAATTAARRGQCKVEYSHCDGSAK